MKRFGPGLLVAAAFIGPGTVTTATMAGALHGLGLVWALLFSVGVTLLLQDMAVRLGVVARRGLADALREAIATPLWRWGMLGLVILAIAIGNAAYEGGNLIGAALGASALTGFGVTPLVGVTGFLAGALLWVGHYRVIERVLMVLVAVMSLVFVATMLARPPDPASLFAPVWPTGGDLVTALALIGTTVVPYNLFLHASIVQARWGAEVQLARALSEARTDSALAIGLGGLVTLAIMSTAAATFFGQGIAPEAADLAAQLEPLLGTWAKGFFAMGLLAAGLTSAITAPLAAAYAVSGALGWGGGLKDGRFRAAWGLVLLSGVVFGLLGTAPLAAILLAQAANALLLPVVAVALLWIMNRDDLLGAHRNGWRSNALAAVAIGFTVLLGGYRLWGLLG